MRSWFPVSLPFSVLLVVSCGSPSPPQTPEEEVVSVQQEGGRTTEQSFEVEFQELDQPEQHYLLFRQELNLLDMNGFLAMESEAIATAVAEAGIKPTGYPVNLFYGWDTDRGWGDAAVAMPVAAGTTLKPYVLVTLPETKALMVEMKGSYDRLSVMHYALNEEISRNGYKPIPPSIEEYVVGPADTDDPAAFITRIYYNYEIPIE